LSLHRCKVIDNLLASNSDYKKAITSL